jgi:hypothetical protein
LSAGAHRGRLLAAAAGLCALATAVGAQTLPMPAPLAERPRDTDPTARLLDPALPPPPPWEYALGAGLGWDSDVSFPAPDGEAQLTLVPQGGVARRFRGPHSELRATAAGRWNGSRDRAELRRYYADLSLDGRYSASSATSWTAGASYGVGYTDSARLLQEQGVLLPLVKARSSMGALGVSHKLGTRATLQAGGRFRQVDFDGSGLIDGTSVRGTMGIARQLSTRSTAEIGYALEDVTDQAGSFYVTHFASVQWARVVSLRSAVLLEAGASYTPDAIRAGLRDKGGFFGGISVDRQMTRSRLTLFVRREVTPAFGTGVSRQATRAGLNTTVALGRAWELRLSGTHVQPDRARVVETAAVPTDDASAAVGRRIGRRVEVSAEARYRRGATPPLPAVSAFQAGLFLTLLTPSGRAIAPGPDR